MKGNILILNLFLLLALITLLALPGFLRIGFLQKPQSQVAGVLSQKFDDVEIKPNLSDFSDLATFKQKSQSPQKVSFDVTLNLFPGQIVSYRQLFSLTNRSNKDRFTNLRLDKAFPKPQGLKIEGQIENGKTSPAVNLEEGITFLLSKNSQAFLTIKLTGGQETALKQVILPLIFSLQSIQN